MTTCKVCNKGLDYKGTGRIPEYCSTKCRVKAHRKKKQPRVNRVEIIGIPLDTVTVQNWVYMCLSCGQPMQRQQKYCSDICRQFAYRQRRITADSPYLPMRSTLGTEKIKELTGVQLDFSEIIKKSG